jgi:hypothetical protein
MVGLVTVTVSPYMHGQAFNSCSKGVADHAVLLQSAEALKWLNKLKNEPFVAYLKHKVGQ